MGFNALSVVKFAVSGAVGIGAGKIVSGVIKNNITAPENLIDKVTMTAAVWAIGGLVASAAKDYTNDAIDSVAGTVGSVVSKMREAAKLERINKGESTFEDEGLSVRDFTQKDGKWVPREDSKKTNEETAPAAS